MGLGQIVDGFRGGGVGGNAVIYWRSHYRTYIGPC